MVGPADSDALVTAIQLALQNLEPIVKVDGANSFSNLIELLKVAKKDDIIFAFRQINSDAEFDDVEMAKYVHKMQKILFLYKIYIGNRFLL